MNLPVVLQEGEQVILIIRRHWMFLYPRLVGMAFFALVPAGALIGGSTALMPGNPQAQQIAMAVSAIWVLFWLVSAYFLWYQYQHDIWILTNQRLIDSNKKNWFNHDLSSADLVNLQDISIVMNGILPTFFHYGDVRCETAGATNVFTLNEISEPSAVLSAIDAARDAARREMYTLRGNAP